MRLGKAAMIASLAMLGSLVQIFEADAQNVLMKDNCKLKKVGGRYGCLVGGPEVEVSAEVYNILPKAADKKDNKQKKR